MSQCTVSARSDFIMVSLTLVGPQLRILPKGLSRVHLGINTRLCTYTYTVSHNKINNSRFAFHHIAAQLLKHGQSTHHAKQKGARVLDPSRVQSALGV